MAISRICIDTCTYSHFMRGDAPAVDLLSRASWIGVPVIVLGELRSGFMRGTRRSQNEVELDRFLANSVNEILEVDDEASEIFAEILTDLWKAGIQIPTNDIWIASVAAREGAPVVTYDAHFASISRIAAKVLPRS